MVLGVLVGWGRCWVIVGWGEVLCWGFGFLWGFCVGFVGCQDVVGCWFWGLIGLSSLGFSGCVWGWVEAGVVWVF